MGKLKFDHDVRVETGKGEGVLLGSERGFFSLSGEVFELLSPLLRGRYTEQQIVERLEGKLSLAEIYYALGLLKKKSLVVESDAKTLPGTAAFWNSLNVGSSFANRKISHGSVSLHIFGRAKKEVVASALRSLHIRITRSGFPVVITDDYSLPRLNGWNRRLHRKGTAWMLLKPIGNFIWLGPIFHPGKTGCWACLAERLNANHIVLEKRSEDASRSAASLPTIQRVAANMAATEILRWLVEGKNKRLEGAIVTLDFHRLEKRTHILTRRSQCKVCGDSKSRTKRIAAPIKLQSSSISSNENGFWRTAAAEQTILRLQKHVSSITGVIPHLDRATTQDVPIPLYHSGNNSSGSQNNLRLPEVAPSDQTCGKGKTDSEAKASAMCEAIERYSGNFSGDEIRLRAKFSDLQSEAIHPQKLLLFSKRQYNLRQEHNARDIPFDFIPKPLDPERKIDWSPVWSLTHSTFKYVPTAYCYYDYPQKNAEAVCLADSNGNAAGNTMEEAILQGFLELVERDGVAVWWYNRLRRPAVDLKSFSEPYFEELQNYYSSIHREFWVLDLTTDLNIPIFAAISRRTDSNSEEIAFGFGAHFHAKVAITRALTEMPQIMPRLDGLPLDDETSSHDPELIKWWRTANVQQHSYLLPDDSQKLKAAFDYTGYESTDLCDYVNQCVRIAELHEMEVLVLDQTRPDIGMPVVKVIVPGLRHFWARFAPGRLYDVPVRQGWLSKKKRESELNKIHLFV